jgi:hypothetical protein
MLARHRFEGAEVSFVFLIIDMSHIMNIPIANLIVPSIVPFTDHLVLVETLNNYRAIGL